MSDRGKELCKRSWTKRAIERRTEFFLLKKGLSLRIVA